MQRMQRALERLHELNRMLQSYERGTEWRPGEESFDSLVRLKEPLMLPPAK